MAYSLQTLTEEQKRQFETEGYLIVKGMFSKEQIEEIKQTFQELSDQKFPKYFEPELKSDQADPLKRYPRFIHPHLFNEKAKKYMIHAPVMELLRDLYEEEPLAVQSMFYYKPPGSRGQALHQDNFYLKVEPGNCIAAWTAIDEADEDNGCLLVVPKTNHYDIVCPDVSDSRESFTAHYVKPPKDQKAIPVVMEKGDVLFFNGNLIHGSYRNKTKERFRRAFICHYANESATKIANYYRPIYRKDGTTVEIEANTEGGPCGAEFASVSSYH
jgi:phytanoyl-CoA hydroxylase